MFRMGGPFLGARVFSFSMWLCNPYSDRRGGARRLLINVQVKLQLQTACWYSIINHHLKQHVWICRRSASQKNCQVFRGIRIFISSRNNAHWNFQSETIITQWVQIITITAGIWSDRNKMLTSEIAIASLTSNGGRAALAQTQLSAACLCPARSRRILQWTSIHQ